ncbi:hypothetical protein Tco_0875303 [Tanacetum coccineum]|uniref:Uncharacterized protein n=1 Tax=Tanacetum coccineum TaxID=301880 RepID=A0ABQ5BRZ1_9ASTR
MNVLGTCGELDAFVSIPDEGDMTFLHKKGKSGAAVGKLVLLHVFVQWVEVLDNFLESSRWFLISRLLSSLLYAVIILLAEQWEHSSRVDIKTIRTWFSSHSINVFFNYTNESRLNSCGSGGGRQLENHVGEECNLMMTCTISAELSPNLHTRDPEAIPNPSEVVVNLGRRYTAVVLTISRMGRTLAATSTQTKKDTPNKSPASHLSPLVAAEKPHEQIGLECSAVNTGEGGRSVKGIRGGG